MFFSIFTLTLKLILIFYLYLPTYIFSQAIKGFIDLTWHKNKKSGSNFLPSSAVCIKVFQFSIILV